MFHTQVGLAVQGWGLTAVLCRDVRISRRYSNYARANHLAPAHSRSFNELATLVEEDPHELQIEDGLPQKVVDTLEQTPSAKGSKASLQALSADAEPDLNVSLLQSLRTEAAQPNELGSAPHLLGNSYTSSPSILS